MGIAVIVTADSSLNGSRSKQIKISVPSDQEVNILFLRYQVMQELVKAFFYLRSTLYVSMPEKADSVDVHNLIPQYNTIYIVALNMYIVKRYNQDRILLRGDVMDGSKSVITIKEYGKISIHLKEIMDSKGITRNYLARISNTRFEVINKWYNGVVEKMDLDILARICYVLECSPADIIKYDKQ
jgi:transcriptional regulator, XRE family